MITRREAAYMARTIVNRLCYPVPPDKTNFDDVHLVHTDKLTGAIEEALIAAAWPLDGQSSEVERT